MTDLSKKITDLTLLPRRSLLKGTAGILATGMFPAIHAQEKITLRYLGTAVNQDKAIGEKFKKDTGIKIQYVAVTTDDVTKRAVTAPNCFDLIDTEYFSLKKIVPTGNLMGIDAKRIKNADKITTAVHQGHGRRQGRRRPGHGAQEGDVPRRREEQVFAKTPTQFMTLIPTVYNADTLGIRPDLIKRPIDTWTELLNPEFKGKAAILNIPSIGIMDAAMVVEAMGLYKYPDKGNMTKKEIDLTIKTLIEAKKAGQFRACGRTSTSRVNLMASGEVVIQSMWSPGRDRRAHQGHRLHLPAAEGRLPRLGGRLRPARHAVAARSSMAPTSSSTGSSTAGPAPTSTARATTAPCSTPPRPRWKPTSGPTGWKARPPRRTSRAPTATCWPRPAQMRDGGSYEARMGGIACWNAVMDENDYMVQKWNEFVAA